MTFDEGRISATTGCNMLMSQYQVAGEALDVTEPMASTLIGCPPEQQADDEWLAGFLTSQPALQLDGSTLTLGDDTSGITLEEREDLPLAGTRWTVDGLVTAEAISTLPSNVSAELTIDDESRLTVSTGCNTGSGGVTIEEDGDNPGAGTLTVEPIATTLRACEPDASAAETHIFGVLHGQVAYVVAGSRLTLTNGTTGMTGMTLTGESS